MLKNGLFLDLSQPRINWFEWFHKTKAILLRSRMRTQIRS